MPYFQVPSKRTRQPQTPTRIAPEWAGRVLFAQVGGIPYDPVSGVVATVAGSPGVAGSVYGRSYSYTSGVNNHSYQVDDAPYLGAMTIFGIVFPPSGASSSNYISKNSADNQKEPFYAGFESAYNGLYVVRAQTDIGFISWRPTSASISAGARSTFAVIWSTKRIETGPTFWVNGTSSAATQVFSGGTTSGDVAGNGQPIKVGNRDNKNATAIELICVLSGTLSDAQYLALYANPYQLFAADPRRIYFGAGGGTTTTDAAIAGTQATDVAAIAVEATTGAAIAGAQATDVAAITVEATTGAALAGTQATDVAAVTVEATTGAAIAGTQDSDVAALVVDSEVGTTTCAIGGTQAPDVAAIDVEATLGLALAATQASDLGYIVVEATLPAAVAATQSSDVAAASVSVGGIWTDVGVSAATWADVGAASSIWTDL